MNFVHTPHGGGAPVENERGDWLVIRRGRTRYPLRPLTSDRFLIGSGTNCHLQLGGGLPILHSLLIREEDCWTVEAIAPEPSLLVNGDVCRRQAIRVDDVIQIADFEFVLYRVDGEKQEHGLEDHSRHLGLTAACREEASRCSASELVNGLERELGLIDGLGDNRAAAAALLRAIARQAAPSTLPVSSLPDVESQIIGPSPTDGAADHWAA